MTITNDVKIWYNKYRPTNIDDLILEEKTKLKVESYISENEIPNLLFTGPPGSGKTSLAQIIINAISPDPGDRLFIDGSKTTGVDIVRTKIEDFLSTCSFGSDMKTVFIDEFDYMSANAQASLRKTIENQTDFGRFICAANYDHKIIDPIKSRLTWFKFQPVSQDYILSYLEHILKAEKVVYDKELLINFVGAHRTDVRQMLNLLEQNVINSELKLNYEHFNQLYSSVEDTIGVIIKFIPEDNRSMILKEFDNISAIISSNDMSFENLFIRLFENSSIPTWAKIIINKYSTNLRGALVPHMHFMAMVYEIYKVGREYYLLLNNKHG